jgi:hypothetical protein
MQVLKNGLNSRWDELVKEALTPTHFATASHPEFCNRNYGIRKQQE